MSKDIYEKFKIRREIIREIKKEDGGSIAEIASVVDFQSKFIRETMTAGHFEGVRMPYFGKFIVKPGRLKKLNDAVVSRRTRKSQDKPGS